MRVQLVKTYVRSTLNFGLPQYALLKQSRSHSAQTKIRIATVEANLKELLAQERSYMVDTTESTSVVYSMVNLPNQAQLIKEGAIKMSLLIAKNKQDSLLRHCLAEYFNMKPQVQRKLPLLFNTFKDNLATTIITEFTTEPTINVKTRAKVKFKQLRHQQNLRDSALVSYITINSRRCNGVDWVLNIKDNWTRRQAIKWRTNTFMRQQLFEVTCDCNLINNEKRSHFGNCNSFKQSTTITDQQWNMFNAHLAKRQAKRELEVAKGVKFAHPDKMQIFDFMINRKEESTLKKIFQSVVKPRARQPIQHQPIAHL